MKYEPEEKRTASFVLAGKCQILIARRPIGVDLHVGRIAERQSAAGDGHAGGHHLHRIHNAGPDELDERLDLAVAPFVGEILLNQVDGGAG